MKQSHVSSFTCLLMYVQCEGNEHKVKLNEEKMNYRHLNQLCGGRCGHHRGYGLVLGEGEWNKKCLFRMHVIVKSVQAETEFPQSLIKPSNLLYAHTLEQIKQLYQSS